MAEPVPLPAELLPVRLDKLKPNAWNPNRMDSAQFAELVEEVKHLGRILKPIVVRTNGDGYEIIDGEHNWRAAQEAGLDTVPCEVLEANDFEAMRQTYKRNQHGKHHRVLEGRLFRSMCQSRGVSNRELAKEIGVSEGTIRDAILWADAADLRNGYAPVPDLGDAYAATTWDAKDENFDGMTTRQLRAYVALPASVRDFWLDAGADLGCLDDRFYGAPITAGEFIGQLSAAGLTPAPSWGPFPKALKKAEELFEWRNRFIESFPTLDGYLPPVAELGLGPDFLESHLPVVARDDGYAIAVEPDEWAALLRDSNQGASNKMERESMIEASIRLCLRKKGVETMDVGDPRVVEAMELVKTAPDFIRDADYLTLADKRFLAHAAAAVPDDGLLEAKHKACDLMANRFAYLTAGKTAEAIVGSDFLEAMRAEWGSLTVKQALEISLKGILQDRARKEEHDLFADRARLTEMLMERMVCSHFRIRTGTIKGRPAIEVLRKRLDKRELPEFLMLASYVLAWEEKAALCAGGERWCQALGVKTTS